MYRLRFHRPIVLGGHGQVQSGLARNGAILSSRPDPPIGGYCLFRSVVRKLPISFRWQAHSRGAASSISLFFPSRSGCLSSYGMTSGVAPSERVAYIFRLCFSFCWPKMYTCIYIYSVAERGKKKKKTGIGKDQGGDEQDRLSSAQRQLHAPRSSDPWLPRVLHAPEPGKGKAERTVHAIGARSRSDPSEFRESPIAIGDQPPTGQRKGRSPVAWNRLSTDRCRNESQSR